MKPLREILLKIKVKKSSLASEIVSQPSPVVGISETGRPLFWTRNKRPAPPARNSTSRPLCTAPWVWVAKRLPGLYAITELLSSPTGQSCRENIWGRKPIVSQEEKKSFALCSKGYSPIWQLEKKKALYGKVSFTDSNLPESCLCGGNHGMKKRKLDFVRPDPGRDFSRKWKQHINGRQLEAQSSASWPRLRGNFCIACVWVCVCVCVR